MTLPDQPQPPTGDRSESADAGALLDAGSLRSRSGEGVPSPSALAGPSMGPMFTLLSLVGSGGMGDVLRARDRTGRSRALKLITSRFAGQSVFVERLRLECKTMGLIRRPKRVAQVVGFFGASEIPLELVQADPGLDRQWIARVHTSPVLVMEYVPGPTLHQLLNPDGRARALPVATSLGLGFELAMALRELHGNDPPIEHRDIKPGNLKVTGGGRRVVILDLGLSRVCWEFEALRHHERGASAVDGPASDPALRHTSGPPATGLTLDYAAPEQIAGLSMGTPADIWAFGCVLFRMLAGTALFPGGFSRLHAGDDEEEARIREMIESRLPSSTPKAVADLLVRCLRLVPDQRCTIRGAVQCLRPFARSLRTARSNIPTSARSLPVGRGPLVSAVVREICARRTQAVVLEGLPGVGKSRVALAAAARCGAMWQDRPWVICHVDRGERGRSGRSDDTAQALAAETLAALRRIPRTALRVPDAVMAGDALDALCVVLGRRRALLILDNVETPAAAIGEFLSELGKRAPETTLLITRRTPLHLHDVASFPIDPLGVPVPGQAADPASLERWPAIRLFLEVARSIVGPTPFAPTEAELSCIVRICHALGGMPWAIATAAANTRTLSLGTVERRLGALIEEPAPGSDAEGGEDVDRLPRTIWSLLDPPVQTLLARLSLFPREFSIEAAEAVCGDPEHPSGPDARVQGCSLLWALKELWSLRIIRPVGEDRFRHVEPLRRHAAWMLAFPERGTRREPAGIEPFASRRASWFLELLERGLRKAAAGDVRAMEPWIREVDRDIESIEAALGDLASRSDGAPRLARAIVALRHYWWACGPGPRAWPWCVLALERLPDLEDASLRCDLLQAASVVAMRCNLDGESERLMGTALDEAGGAGLTEVAARIEGNLAILMRKQSRFPEAMEHLRAARALARECGASGVEFNGRILEAVIHKLCGRLDEARAGFETLATELSRTSHVTFSLSVLQNLGEIDVAEGRLREARARFRAVWRGHPRSSRMDRARAVLWLGIALTLFGDLEAGLRRVAAAEPLYRASGGICDAWLEGWLAKVGRPR